MGAEVNLPNHRQVVWFLKTALDCLGEAEEMGYLPYDAQRLISQMADDLTDLLERLPRSVPALGPLSDAELGWDPDRLPRLAS